MWLTIDEAAVALGIGVKRAYQLSKHWQRTPGKPGPGFPRRYLLADIRKTAFNRATN